MRRFIVLPLALAAVLGAPAARAQVTDPAAAQGLFDQAKQLVAQGRLAEACPKFLASFKFDPKAGTAVNLADCYEKTGQLASAWARYLEAAALAQRGGQAEREQYAREHAASLEPRIARLTIAAASPPRGLEVLRDGAPMDLAILGTPVPIDPGKHQVEARAPGKRSWSTTVEIPAGAARVAVEIPLLPDGVPGSVALAPAGGALGPSQPPPEQASGSPRKPIGIALLAVGGAGVVVGAITGSLALGKHSSLVTACPHPDACANQNDAISSYHTLGTVADVGLFAGGALAVTGLVLVLTAPKAASGQAWIRPVVGPGFAGAVGSF